MVRQLKAWEAEGDAIKRQCKARTQQSQQSQLNFNLPTTTDQSQASLTTQGGANPTLPILPIAIGGGALVLLVVGAVIVKKRRKAAKLAAAGVDAR
jgi:4-amino-4-deoxy-L-arabinose transferase-like glycosyltransferase